MEAIRMIQDEPGHLQQLWENTRYFKKAMTDLGFDIGHSQTPITPVMAGQSKEAVELSRQLFEEGLFAKPIVFPLVAKDKARVRINVTAQHTKEDLEEAIVIFENVGKRMKLI
jgi:glycine C-acetyltransferase